MPDDKRQDPNLSDLPVNEPRTSPWSKKAEPFGPQPAESTPPSPPPPPSLESEVGVRTMSGDAESLSQSGGAEAKPKLFRPKDILSKEPIFEPKSTFSTEQKPIVEEIVKKKHPNLIIIIIGITAFVVLGGVAVYFLVLPMFGGQGEPVEPVPPPAEVMPPPPVAEPEPPPPPAFMHQSLFTAGAVESVNLSLTALTPSEVASAISTSIGEETAAPATKEIGFQFEGATVNSFALLEALFGTLTEETRNLFVEDFTGFVYKDANGLWPGYVFGLTGANVDATAPAITLLKSTPTLFYTSDPGNPSGVFKEGSKFSASIQSVEYLPYSLTGASFNVALALHDSKLYAVVSTSFNGIKEAFRLLGW
ncbi:MAG: hypothetical protein HYS87_01190 [Candidatus Colwellbacteria bacterium]|nr:hypothetical protein [Candidatus Colwellbacteria bacterium]